MWVNRVVLSIWTFFTTFYGFIGFINAVTTDTPGEIVEFCFHRIPGDDEKYCHLRESYYYRYEWNYISGYYCYFYTNPYRLTKEAKGPETIQTSCGEDKYDLKVYLADDKSYYVFDYHNETSLNFLKTLFRTEEFFNNYVKCCKDAEDCCDTEMTNENIMKDKYTCPAIWDGWSCFPPTPSHTFAKLTCSTQAYSYPDGICELESEKECFEGGNWNQTTNYDVCSIAPIYQKRHILHIISFYIAIALSLPAIIIFLSFQKLRRTTRVTLHRNLLIMTVLRNILTIMSKELVILDALKSDKESNHVMDNNGVACRVLAFFESSAINGMYACMFVDSFYLHKVIVRTFANEPKVIYLYLVVAVLTFLPSLIWATLKGIKDTQNCWMVEDDPNDQWVVDGFRLTILIINTLLLIDIIRVIFMKRKQGDLASQSKAALRATLFLIPLFGINFIATANRTLPDKSCASENIYYFIFYPMQAAQGVMVAITFCYLNSEVHAEISNAYRKFNLYLQQKYGWSLRRKTVFDRRTTTATYVGHDEDSNEKNGLMSCFSRKKLHRPSNSSTVSPSDSKGETNFSKASSAL